MQAPEVLGGRYELRGVLGCGGMAEVRDAWDVRLGRPVAVKVLYPSVSAQPDCRRRFATEARAAARLNHPRIVAVRDSGVHHGRHYIVLERFPGQSPADVLARGGPLSTQQVRAIMHRRPTNLGALADAISAGYVTPLTRLRPDIDPALAETIERSMARDPRWRFGTAEQMRACLNAPTQQSRRARGVLPVTAVLAVLVLAALLVAVSSGKV